MGNKTKRKKKTGKIIGVVIGIILIALVAYGVYLYFDIQKEIGGEGKQDSEVTVVIEKGDTTVKIAKRLKESGVIRYPDVFVQIAQRQGVDKKFQPGTCQIQLGSSYEEIFAVLQKPVAKDSVRVTFPEGYSVEEMIAVLVEKGLGDEAKYREIVLNGDFDYDYLPEAGTKNRLEGYLYPDTYDFFKDAAEESIIGKLLANFDAKLKENGVIKKAELAGMSLKETITLASVIEKEGQAEDELPVISSVFHNRLDIDMKLQSCATVNYVLPDEEKKWILTYEDMKTESPYNTYLYKGLPPTPIANPGMKAILAALAPADTEYLYMCAKGDGTHAFAETYEQHQANEKKYLRGE